MKKNKYIKKYISKLKSEIPTSYTLRKDFLADIGNSLELYAIDNPKFSYDDLIENFGEPAKIADTLIADEAPLELRKGMSTETKSRLRLLLIIAFIIFVAYIVIDITSDLATQSLEETYETTIPSSTIMLE